RGAAQGGLEHHALRRPAGGSQLETGKIECRGNGAADQGPGAKRTGALPSPRRHRRLRPFISLQIDAEPMADRLLVFADDGEFERRPGMVVPELDGIDAVPMRHLACLQQVVDRGHVTARLIPVMAMAVDLAEMSALGMRLEPKPFDHTPRFNAHASAPPNAATAIDSARISSRTSSCSIRNSGDDISS